MTRAPADPHQQLSMALLRSDALPLQERATLSLRVSEHPTLRHPQRCDAKRSPLAFGGPSGPPRGKEMR